MWLSYNKIFNRLSYIKLVLSVIDFENFGGTRMNKVNYNIKDEADAISIKALSGIIESAIRIMVRKMGVKCLLLIGVLLTCVI